jgi:NADH-quinone oxidoreductase subunit K
MLKYLFLTFNLFLIGSAGLFYFYRHLLLILISFELILLSVNLNFGIFSACFDDLYGQIIVLFILTIAAAETALGLALVIIFYRLKGGLYLKLICLLKG